MDKIRVLIVDDHAIVRMGMVALLRTQPNMEVVGEARNGRQAVELADSLKPDVVVMDLMMPKMRGSEATRLIREAHPEIKIVILSSFGTSKEMSDAIASGADAALMKDEEDANLVSTIRLVVAGNKAIPANLLAQINQDNDMFKLSDRHLEILSSIAEGQSNADIAKQFSLSEVTIKKHLSKIFQRLGVANRSEAVALALRKQLIKT